ncbi:hypothetical protein DPMN_128769 [Dreissena polymorpha]|uniref:Uncharacterized protein n=1 Tax=Dreissena polymorpha TaxID=45954 RepID=A0A9D4H4K7_DREPO|nr:hypothetical protein DPMN_128769 [Dreissena polymorpha]
MAVVAEQRTYSVRIYEVVASALLSGYAMLGLMDKVTGSMDKVTAIWRSQVRSPLGERSLELPQRHQVLVIGPGNGLEINVASRTNLLTKFHEDWTINEKCPTAGGHVFQATKTIFKLIQDIIGKNLLTKFHDDRKINVTSRVLTRKIALPLRWPWFSTNRHHF